MAAKRTTTKKSSTPTVDALLSLILNDETEHDDTLIEAVEALTEQFDGLTIVTAAILGDDDDADEADEDEEGTDDAEEGDEGDDEPYTEEELSDMDTADLKAVLEDLELELDGRFSSKKAIAAILEAQEGDEDEGDEEGEGDEEDEDLGELGAAADDDDTDAQDRLTELAEELDLDPNEYPTWVELADAIGEADESDEGEDEPEDDVEELDEDALNAMKPAELTKVYKEVVGEAPTKGMSKAAKIEAIFEAAEAE